MDSPSPASLLACPHDTVAKKVGQFTCCKEPMEGDKFSTGSSV